MSKQEIEKQIALYNQLIERAKKLEADYQALHADMVAVGIHFSRWEWDPPWDQIGVLGFRIESAEEMLA